MKIARGRSHGQSLPLLASTRSQMAGFDTRFAKEGKNEKANILLSYALRMCRTQRFIMPQEL
jgi:hypothetical protein